jgi:hypothetical protein
MTYIVRGLSPSPFAHLYGRDDAALAAAGARRYVVDAQPGFPDRVGLVDLAPGETALLLNFVHQPADTPFRASHAIFVREGATEVAESRDALPEMLRRRMLSIRAFDAAGMMVDAALVDGSAAEPVVIGLLAAAATDCLHVHAATRGCYLARIERG